MYHFCTITLENGDTYPAGNLSASIDPKNRDVVYLNFMSSGIMKTVLMSFVSRIELFDKNSMIS